MNFTDATTLVFNLWLTERAAFVSAKVLYLECEVDLPGTDVMTLMEDTTLKAEEDYELCLSALCEALSYELTPANGMLCTVSAVWDKRIAEADDYFND